MWDTDEHAECIEQLRVLLLLPRLPLLLRFKAELLMAYDTGDMSERREWLDEADATYVIMYRRQPKGQFPDFDADVAAFKADLDSMRAEMLEDMLELEHADANIDDTPLLPVEEQAEDQDDEEDAESEAGGVPL